MIALRNESPADSAAIAAVTQAAFTGVPHSSGNEAAIVAALRAAGQLTVSLVAEQDGQVVGHVAISPVQVSDGSEGWYGLGPVSVLPACQGQGIGSALITQALTQLRRLGAAGCVVLGEPGYYQRFGFAVVPGLLLPGVPALYFQAQPFGTGLVQGEVTYSAAFTVPG